MSNRTKVRDMVPGIAYRVTSPDDTGCEFLRIEDDGSRTLVSDNGWLDADEWENEDIAEWEAEPWDAPDLAERILKSSDEPLDLDTEIIRIRQHALRLGKHGDRHYRWARRMLLVADMLGSLREMGA